MATIIWIGVCGTAAFIGAIGMHCSYMMLHGYTLKEAIKDIL